MGREVRRVPKDWQHPKDSSTGEYIPMYEKFPYTDCEIAEGLEAGWLEDAPPHYGCSVMPQWAESERTHLQMYEDTSEGTPISPVMETPEELATWLAENGASSFGDSTASYEAWLETIKRVSAVSAVFTADTGMISGVEANLDLKSKQA